MHAVSEDSWWMALPHICVGPHHGLLATRSYCCIALCIAIYIWLPLQLEAKPRKGRRRPGRQPQPVEMPAGRASQHSSQSDQQQEQQHRPALVREHQPAADLNMNGSGPGRHHTRQEEDDRVRQMILYTTARRGRVRNFRQDMVLSAKMCTAHGGIAGCRAVCMDSLDPPSCNEAWGCFAGVLQLCGHPPGNKLEGRRFVAAHLSQRSILKHCAAC